MSRAIGTEPCPRCVKLGNDTRGDNLVLWDNGHGHCFACGHHKFPHIPFNKVKENVPKALLPFDFQREIPGAAWKWLLQFGLPYSFWQEITGYSPSEQRLIFRLGEWQQHTNTWTRTHDPIRFSIGRYIPEVQVPGEREGVGSVPLSIPNGRLSIQRDSRPSKWRSWGDSHRHAEICSPNEGTSIVLVEDLISAAKVGHVTTAIPLFGTQVHPCVIYYLLNDIRPIKLWLDKDQEFNVRKTALRLGSILNRDISIIVTDNDPKLISINEIKNKI